MASAIIREEANLLACVHCGLCLPACPTYDVLRDELDSPRGRLHLMRAAVEARIEIADVFDRHISRCLGCRACETACPSGVRYGRLIEASRSAVVGRRGAAARIERSALNAVFGRAASLDAAFGALRLARGARLMRWIAGRPGTRRPSRLRFAAALVDATWRHAPGPARAPEDPRGSSAVLLDGCVMPRLFAHAHLASANLLRRAGFRLLATPGAGCCGALHAHAGLLDDARGMARRNIDAFEGAAFIVTESAGCGAMMKNYGDLLSRDPEYAERARGFSSRVRDLSEILVEAGLRPGPSPVAERIAYDAPCHLHHAQKVTEAPSSLLATVPGAEVVRLEDSERCCGGAGLYNLVEPALSWEILGLKMERICASGATIVASGNPGCLMQLGAGAHFFGVPARVLHPAEILEATWRNPCSA